MRLPIREVGWLWVCVGVLGGQEPAAVTGTVADSVAARVPNVKLTLSSLDRVLQTASDNEGRFRFPSAKPGAYDLQIYSPGFSRQTLHLDLSTGGDRTLNIVLQLPPTPEVCGGLQSSPTYLPAESTNPRLTGTVWNDERKRRPLSASKAFLLKEGGNGSVLSRHSDKTGRFQFGELSPGDYSLRIASPGYVEQTLKVLVPRENDVVVDVSLLKQGEIILCQ